MNSKEWLEQNPDVKKEDIVNELIESRQREKVYLKQLMLANNQLAEIRYIVKPNDK